MGVLRLFRSKIRRSSHHDVGFGQLNIFVRAFGDPEVGQFDFAAPGQHHVVRFDVAMNDLLFGNGFQRFRHRFGYDDRVDFAETRNGMQHIADGSPVHIFHNDIAESAVGFVADVQHIDDVRVADRTCHLRFLNKAFDEFAAAFVKSAGKDFCRAENAKRFMPYQIDAAHASLTEFPDNDVAVDPVARLQIILAGILLRFRRIFLNHSHIDLIRIDGNADHGKLGSVPSGIRGGVFPAGGVDHGKLGPAPFGVRGGGFPAGSVDHGDFGGILCFILR